MTVADWKVIGVASVAGVTTVPAAIDGVGNVIGVASTAGATIVPVAIDGA
jgi:hypothetical protein